MQIQSQETNCQMMLFSIGIVHTFQTAVASTKWSPGLTPHSLLKTNLKPMQHFTQWCYFNRNCHYHSNCCCWQQRHCVPHNEWVNITFLSFTFFCKRQVLCSRDELLDSAISICIFLSFQITFACVRSIVYCMITSAQMSNECSLTSVNSCLYISVD